MACHTCHVCDTQYPLLGWWILVIVLIAVLGALAQPPPESFNQTLNHDNSKIQYITIGGATQTKVSTK